VPWCPWFLTVETNFLLPQLFSGLLVHLSFLNPLLSKGLDLFTLLRERRLKDESIF